MADINIPPAVKQNLDLIVGGILTLGLLGYGAMEYSSSSEARTESEKNWDTEVGNYKRVQTVSVDYMESAKPVTTERKNLDVAKATSLQFTNFLQEARARFKPLDIPTGIVIDQKTGAIQSVTLMQGGEFMGQEATVQVTGQGKGAEIKAVMVEKNDEEGNLTGKYRIDELIVEKPGSGYKMETTRVNISEGGGSTNPGMSPSEMVVGPDPAVPTEGVPGSEPGMNPGMNAGMTGMMNPMMMGMGSMGSTSDETKATIGMDTPTFRNFMYNTIYTLQKQCKENGIRLPKTEESKEYRFGFSHVWDQFDFKSHEREILAYQLAEIRDLCNALIRANIHEIYNVKRMRILMDDEASGSMEYLSGFDKKNVAKYASTSTEAPDRLGLVPGSRVMPYEITFRGFSTELAGALHELYSSEVFFLVKDIGVVKAPAVIEESEEGEEEGFTLGGAGVFSAREGYGRAGMGMDPRYAMMMGGGMGPYGRGGMYGGMGAMPERKRPASLLLDEDPLKITLRVDSIKLVNPAKDQDDAFSQLEGEWAGGGDDTGKRVELIKGKLWEVGLKIDELKDDDPERWDELSERYDKLDGDASDAESKASSGDVSGAASVLNQVESGARELATEVGMDYDTIVVEEVE